MTDTFKMIDHHNGDPVLIDISDNRIVIYSGTGSVTIEHHTLAAIFEKSNGYRLAELDPETGGHAMRKETD